MLQVLSGIPTQRGILIFSAAPVKVTVVAISKNLPSEIRLRSLPPIPRLTRSSLLLLLLSSSLGTPTERGILIFSAAQVNYGTGSH